MAQYPMKSGVLSTAEFMNHVLESGGGGGKIVQFARCLPNLQRDQLLSSQVCAGVPYDG